MRALCTGYGTENSRYSINIYIATQEYNKNEKKKNSKPHNIHKNQADKREKNNPILCATIVCNFMPNNTSL